MGVDAALYVWGPKISDEELERLTEELLKREGVHDSRYPPLLERQEWNPVPDTDLIEVDMGGSRSFNAFMWKGRWSSIGKGYWPHIKKTLLAVKELFPNHFLIYTDDVTDLDCNLSESIVNDLLFSVHDLCWTISPYNKENKMPEGLTVDDVLATLDAEQQEALYFVAGHALGHERQKENKHPRLMDLWLGLNDDQKIAFNFVIGSALQKPFNDDDMAEYLKASRFP